jgi:hypothetical protein
LELVEQNQSSHQSRQNRTINEQAFCFGRCTMNEKKNEKSQIGISRFEVILSPIPAEPNFVQKRKVRRPIYEESQGESNKTRIGIGLIGHSIQPIRTGRDTRRERKVRRPKYEESGEGLNETRIGINQPILSTHRSGRDVTQNENGKCLPKYRESQGESNKTRIGINRGGSAVPLIPTERNLTREQKALRSTSPFPHPSISPQLFRSKGLTKHFNVFVEKVFLLG